MSTETPPPITPRERLIAAVTEFANWSELEIERLQSRVARLEHLAELSAKSQNAVESVMLDDTT